MQKSPRNGASIDRIYLHKNEGPETEGGAQGLLGYLQTIDGGYHVIVDDKDTVRAANDDEVVWGEGGDNEHALAICLVGWSSENAAEYGTDAYSQAEIERAAQQVAAWCKQYNVPAAHVAPGAPGQAPTERGIAEHADDHDPSSQGHTDPGVGFPIDAFIQRVQAINAPPVDWAAIAKLVQWVNSVKAKPIRCTEVGERVISLKQLLHKHGYSGMDLTNPVYGPGVFAAVKAFKVSRKLPYTAGGVVGGACAVELVQS